MNPPTIQPVIGIIGGSGLYDIDGLENKAWRKVATPWGDPSDALLEGTLAGVRCVFLPRHGRGHPLSPSHLNYRANIDALKRAGCTDVLSLSAVGSLKEELPPGHFVIIDQFIDRSFAREKSFFGDGCVDLAIERDDAAKGHMHTLHLQQRWLQRRSRAALRGRVKHGVHDRH